MGRFTEKVPAEPATHQITLPDKGANMGSILTKMKLHKPTQAATPHFTQKKKVFFMGELYCYLSISLIGQYSDKHKNT